MDEIVPNCRYCGSMQHALACPEHSSNIAGHTLYMRKWKAGRRDAEEGKGARDTLDPTYHLGYESVSLGFEGVA